MSLDVCPLPARGPSDRIRLREGAGGQAMRELIQDLFLARAVHVRPDEVGPRDMDDGAAIRLGDGFLVMTTDAHVIQPAIFPGGDIGRLSICGTVNDLAVMGATDILGLTVAVVLEEGFSRADLERIWSSLQDAAEEAGAPVLTGDTKVMRRGELDGIVITTSGVGLARRVVRSRGLHAGDQLIVSGTVGDHGLAVLAARAGLGLEGALLSDVAPVRALVAAALEAGGEGIVAMKDPTRGGLAGALSEMIGGSNLGVLLDEASVPLSEPVRAAAELLGIDPLIVANEGKVVFAVRPEATAAVLAALRAQPLGTRAAVIGTATVERPGWVVLDTGFGRRLVVEPEGEPLPRIC